MNAASGERQSRGRALGAAVTALCLLAMVAGCRALKVERATVQSDDDWLTEGDTQQRHNATAEALPVPLEQVWDYNANGGFGAISPLILGRAVLVGNRKGEVHAVDVETGKRLGLQKFGDAIEGSPVVAHGILYVPVGWGKRTVFAYDLSRSTVVWRVRGAPVKAGLMVVADALLAADVDGDVRAYDTDDGTLRWSHAVGDRSIQATPVQSASGDVVVVDDAGRVVALNPANGDVRWTQDVAAPVLVSLSADDERIYLATSRGRLVALDQATGAVRWTFRVPNDEVRFTPAAVGDGDVAFGGSDGTVHLLDARTGTERWATNLEEAIRGTPLLTKDGVIVGDLVREILVLERADGAVAWRTELKGRVKSPMAIKDGHLIVLAEPHTVYMFRSSEASYATSKED